MERVSSLLDEVGNAPTVERAKERSEDLVRALVAFYGDGLERLLNIVYEAAGDRSAAVFAALCDDRYVESLLALHGLHPLAIEDRVQAALDAIRPYLESHEGRVELVRVADGIAYVRLGGSCDGCHASAATLKNAVETAILEHVAEITAVYDDATADAPQPPNQSPLHSLKLQSDWVVLDALPDLRTTGLAQVDCSGTAVLLVRHESTVFAYRDRCPACTRALAGAALEWPFVRCAACRERFDVVHAGRSEGDGGQSAEPFPLVREGERARIAIPLGV